MVFSKEDNNAFNNSVVMKELEKIANELDLLNFDPAILDEPIATEEEKQQIQEEWEDESDIVDDYFEDVVEEKAEEILEDNTASVKKLINNLQKIAHEVAPVSQSAAFAIERAISKIDSLGGCD